MNKYIKEQIHIIDESKDWAPVKSSSFFKEEYRKTQSEKEIIESYICCMNEICNKIKTELRPGLSVLFAYSLCIPYLYICRHSIELILKRAIEGKSNVTKTGHKILMLWEEYKNNHSEKNLKYYDELIETINFLDNNGEKFRYVKDSDGNAFANKPLFLNVELLNTDINKLKNELLEEK